MAIVFAVVTITFFVVHLAHGKPCGSDDRPLPPEICQALCRRFGCDKPLLEQYGKYLAALARGDLGESIGLHRPVADALADAIPNTFTLALAALLIDFALGLALGIYQAVRAGRFGDVAVGNVALLVNSMPVFWLGLVLLLVFAQWLRWFPAGGITNPILCPRLDSPYCLLDFLWHLTLPALTLGLVGAASTARYQRAAMLEVVRQDYVRTARAKGLPERRVLLVHAPRNALLPIITLFGLAFPFLFTGGVLIETVFAWPAPGRRFFRHPTAGPGVFVLTFFVTIAIAAPVMAPYPPYYQIDIEHPNHPPSAQFLLGTDPLSRDVWSRVVYGARVSLGIGAVAMLVAASVGTAVGAVAGYFRRWVDTTLMRLVDVGLAMPRIFVLLMAVALWEHIALWVLVLLIGLTGWFGTSRLVRAEVLSLREREFVAAARALGAGAGRVIFRHVLPNAAAP